MKKRLYFLAICFATLITSCEIAQETRFNKDGSGDYKLKLDLTSMMQMGGGSNTGKASQQMDTLVDFSELLKLKQDSISKLSFEEREKAEALKNFKFKMVSDSISGKFETEITYAFDSVDKLKNFAKILDSADNKSIKSLTGEIGEDTSKMPDLNKNYDIKFSKKKFTYKITEEGIKESQEKKQDSTNEMMGAMGNMITLKSKFIFPYRIKSISNKKATITSDFKGYEINANLFELGNNPKLLDTEVLFE